MRYAFADIILPTPLAQLFTYSVPEELELFIGARVVVSFGQRHFYTGIVARLHNEEPNLLTVKPVERLLDNEPLVGETHIRFWQQLANYYQTPIGDFYQAAVPQLFRIESKTKLTLADGIDFSSDLPEKVRLLCSTLAQEPHLTAQQLNEKSGKGNLAEIQRLIELGVIQTEEDFSDKFQPKQLPFITTTFTPDDEGFQAATVGKRLTDKQQTLLNTLITLLREQQTDAIELRQLKATPIVGQLEKKGLVRKEMRIVNRLQRYEQGETIIHTLSTEQLKALNDIQKAWEKKDVVLLHGVTASGKTEVYVKLIEECIRQGKQTLMLIPEIALTTQLAQRLRNTFGDKLGIYHSKFSNHERAEIWNHVLHNDRYQVVLGTRSSLFLPFRNLGLIVVDEEHDTSYKQQDYPPKYNARNAAIMLGHLFHAKTLLGSATPSLETYCNTQTGRYGLVELTTRFRNIQLPEVEIINMEEAYRKGLVRHHLSQQLRDAITETLERKEQVILFQNRRGFSPFTECNVCGWTPKCQHCDVTLTYHKRINKLKCHYCGNTHNIYSICPQCGNPRLLSHGIGTEQIEEEIKLLFPDARIARMDLDTTTGKHAYETIIRQLETREIDILVGTQMVTKGLDFKHVKLVGIINADSLLSQPDFRASERAFQMLTQVSGRAGREEAGRVMMQTSMPQHPIIQYVLTNDYRRFFNSQMNERHLFLYPPYCRLVAINIKHRQSDVVRQFAEELASELRTHFQERLLGPNTPEVSRISNFYLQNILIKADLNHTEQAKALINTTIRNLAARSDYRSIVCDLDIDPE